MLFTSPSAYWYKRTLAKENCQGHTAINMSNPEDLISFLQLEWKIFSLPQNLCVSLYVILLIQAILNCCCTNIPVLWEQRKMISTNKDFYSNSLRTPSCYRIHQLYCLSLKRITKTLFWGDSGEKTLFLRLLPTSIFCTKTEHLFLSKNIILNWIFFVIK